MAQDGAAHRPKAGAELRKDVVPDAEQPLKDVVLQLRAAVLRPKAVVARVVDVAQLRHQLRRNSPMAFT